MAVLTAEIVIEDEVSIEYCPICGEPLDPESESPLCEICELDQAEKWADYVAECEQAAYPY